MIAFAPLSVDDWDLRDILAKKGGRSVLAKRPPSCVLPLGMLVWAYSLGREAQELRRVREGYAELTGKPWWRMLPVIPSTMKAGRILI